MKKKATILLIGIVLIFLIVFGVYNVTKSNDKATEPIQDFLTTLFTVEKYEVLDNIVIQEDEVLDEVMLEMMSVMGEYHINYNQVKNSMSEREFNDLLTSRLLTLTPKVANKYQVGTTIENIVITPTDNNISKFELSLCVGEICGNVTGEISIEKVDGEWIVTYFSLNSNSLMFLFEA